ncbi:hypothetical protein [Micromonospora lutea]|nr:hypothetical protein [Micromonospora lutea]
MSGGSGVPGAATSEGTDDGEQGSGSSADHQATAGATVVGAGPGGAAV